MLKSFRSLASLFVVASFLSISAGADEPVVRPQMMSKAEIAGEIFSRPDMIKTERPGGPTLGKSVV